MADEQIKKKEIESALAKIPDGDFFGNLKGPAGGFGLPQPTHPQTIGKRG